MNKTPVIGFVRYSQKIIFGNQKVAKDVFEPGYFEYRFEIFKNITLKSFQQQTNPNFSLLVLHSVSMPEDYKKRFYELEKENPFLYNVFIEDTQEGFNQALQESIEYVSFENDTAVTFRIDNDDAVQNDFIEKLNAFLKPEFKGFCISMPIIYGIKRIAKELYMLEEIYFPANAVGLAWVTGKENYSCILEKGDHDLVNTKFPMILSSKLSGGGVMTINGENEINSINKNRSVILNKKSIEKYLLERKIENIDLDCLKIFLEKNKQIKYLYSKTIGLLMPPVFPLIFKKLKNYF